jgi:hypothetical protein
VVEQALRDRRPLREVFDAHLVVGLPREDLDMTNLRGEVLWGRVGPSGRGSPGGASASAKPADVLARSGKGLPEERYGVMMVFRTFDRVSYAIIMDTSRPVNVSDIVRNP